MTFEYDVIVYGTVCLDLLWRVEQWPSPGSYEHILDERKMIGGEAANTALALAKWGARVALVGTARGEDPDGHLLREMLEREAASLDTRFLATLPGARNSLLRCIATPDGHRTMFGSGFTDMQTPVLTPELAPPPVSLR